MNSFTNTEEINQMIENIKKTDWTDAIPEDKNEKWALSHPVDMVERYVSAITHAIQEYMSHKSTLEMGYGKGPDVTEKLIHTNAMRLEEAKFENTKKSLFEFVGKVNKLTVSAPPREGR